MPRGEKTERRVAVVTGASRGIGRAVAESLAADGKHVVLVARSEGPLESLREAIAGCGGEASVAAVDISDAAALTACVDRVAEDLGRLDILVNNAGITRDNLLMRMTDDEFHQVIQVNLFAAFVACRAAARPMMRGKFGRIINVSSTSGVVGNAGQSNYAAAKAGLTGLTKSIARELGGKGVTANTVAPGFIETDMTSDLPAEVKDRVLSAMALRRLGTPEDVAALVTFLASDGAGFITGQTVCTDGGLTMC